MSHTMMRLPTGDVDTTHEANGTPARSAKRKYTHNPYSRGGPPSPAVPVDADVAVSQTENDDVASCTQVPVIHSTLIGRIPFVTYPTLSGYSERVARRFDRREGRTAPPRGAQKIFVGSLPRFITKEQILFVFALANVPVLYIDRLFRGGRRRNAITTNVYVADADDAKRVAASLHKRVLFDNAGVFFAVTPQQVRELNKYTEMVALTPEARWQSAAYQTTTFEPIWGVHRRHVSDLFDPRCHHCAQRVSEFQNWNWWTNAGGNFSESRLLYGDDVVVVFVVDAPVLRIPTDFDNFRTPNFRQLSDVQQLARELFADCGDREIWCRECHDDRHGDYAIMPYCASRRTIPGF